MSNNNTQQSYREEDTISLVDLLAVIIRYRRLIIVGTLTVSIVAAIILYALPLAGVKAGPQPEYIAEQRLWIREIPADIAQHLSINVSATIMNILNNPQVVGDIYRDFEDDPPENRSEEKYLSMIRGMIAEKKLELLWEGTTRILTVRYTNSDPERASAFVETLISSIGDRITEQLSNQFVEAEELLLLSLEATQTELATLLTSALERSELLLDNVSIITVINYLEQSGSSTIMAFRDAEMSLERLRSIRSGSLKLYTLIGTPVVYEESAGSRSMIVIIMGVSAFFFTIFLAFVLEYIHRIKQEPKEMEKLRIAWSRK